MDSPQSGGMERVSLITLLQKKRRHRKTDKTEKGYERGRENDTVNNYYLLIVSTENVLKCLVKYEQTK